MIGVLPRYLNCTILFIPSSNQHNKEFTQFLLSALVVLVQDELRRGDVPKSIECHMHENGVSEDAAREHIRQLIRGNWRAINGDRSFTSCFEENLKMIAINIPRMAHCMYQYGDGYGKPDGVIEDRIRSLLIEPILM